MLDRIDGLGKLLAFLFQCPARTFLPFLRYRFGCRYLKLAGNFLWPVAALHVAILARQSLPHEIVYAPLRLLPPFNALEANQAFFTSQDKGLPDREVIAFLAFGAAFVLVSLGHFAQVRISRWRKTDPTYTRFWGLSRLSRLPGVRNLPPAVVQERVEPAFLVLLGFGLCATVPVFGMYLMAGGVSYGVSEFVAWHRSRGRELDARDALVRADFTKADHEAARKHHAAQATRRKTALSPQTLVRIQETPHALLALTPEETADARAELGGARFARLCDQLGPNEQQAVRDRMSRVRPARSRKTKKTA